ncbi:MAG: cell division ATP-binding protein FtsE [Clostridia bacterium]|nr:cell division ATP-binding protein FtsE [Clostridia bacterium]MBQ4248826.1 cell division ATP-binding protein FtsE [Clostridia bacterium]
MVLFNKVTKTYANGTKALEDVSFRIDQGEFVFIIGASGAGKTTITKLITRQEAFDSGEVVVNKYRLKTLRNSQIPYLRRTVGVVFQDFRLIDNKTVYENVAFAMRIVNAPAKEIRARVPHVLSLVGLSHKAKAYPTQLSGGEQQRVAIARAIINSPSILIADEPTGNVDPNMSREIMDLFQAINDRGTTIIVVTHELSLVRRMKKRVIQLDGGRILYDKVGGGQE